MVRTDHERFQAIIMKIMIGRRMYHPDSSLEEWICQSFDDEERFLQLFPDPAGREEMMDRLEARSQNEQDTFKKNLAKMIHRGLRRADIRALQYKNTVPENDDVASEKTPEEAGEESA